MGKWSVPPALKPGLYCSTGKRAYRTREAATEAIDSFRDLTRKTGRKRPKRTYVCPDCGAHHLTSMPWAP